jgi:cell division initiation protein
MALTPIDVQQKTFGTALRGYDLDEVDDFLDEVVTSLKSYEERLVESQERIAALQAELEGKGDSESAISRALVTAQRSADALVAEAEADADRMRAEAKAETDRMLAEAAAEHARLDAARVDEQAKLNAELAGMREKIAAIRATVLDLNASIATRLDEMDGAVEADARSVVVLDEAAEPESADVETDDEQAPAPVLPVTEGDEGTVEAAPEVSAESSKWYEPTTESSDQELELDLTADDEWAASATVDQEPAPSDATVEMSAVGSEEGDADPLDEAIAEATFQAPAGGQDAEPDEGWAPEADADDLAEDVTDDTSDVWEEAWGSEDEDRPRRPWE